MWNETKEVKGETRGQVNLLGFVCREGMAKQGTWGQCLVVGPIRLLSLQGGRTKLSLRNRLSIFS